MNVDTTSEQKKLLRKKYSEIRKAITGKEEKCEAIFSALISTSEYKNAGCIALYNSFGSEADTSHIAVHALSCGKTIAYPRVCSNDMKFYRYYKNMPFEKSRFGVQEPFDEEKNIISPDKIDLVIVPGLCFDKSKNRLGYGGGFYDRFLIKTKAVKIAICFDEQIIENGSLPVSENDVKADLIITDKRIFR